MNGAITLRATSMMPSTTPNTTTMPIPRKSASHASTGISTHFSGRSACRRGSLRSRAGFEGIGVRKRRAQPSGRHFDEQGGLADPAVHHQPLGHRGNMVRRPGMWSACWTAIVIDHARPSWPANRWITALMRMFRPQIVELLHARDAEINRRRIVAPRSTSSRTGTWKWRRRCACRSRTRSPGSSWRWPASAGARRRLPTRFAEKHGVN